MELAALTISLPRCLIEPVLLWWRRKYVQVYNHRISGVPGANSGLRNLERTWSAHRYTVDGSTLFESKTWNWKIKRTGFAEEEH